MLDDEDDKRIKEAAAHYHPEYDDSAWEKLAQLLDQHLPVKKEKKRGLFIIPSLVGCLLLMMGLYYYYKPAAFQNLLSKNKTGRLNSSNAFNQAKNISGKDRITTRKEKKVIEKNTAYVQIKNPAKTKRDSRSSRDENANGASATFHDLPLTQITELKKKGIEKSNRKNQINPFKTFVSDNAAIEKQVLTPGKKDDKAGLEKLPDQKDTIGQRLIEKIRKVKAPGTGKQANKREGHFKNNFAISISAGPDVSSVNNNKIGKLTLVYGGGIGYSMSRKFNIRAGFYFSKKIYSVGPHDYKVPAGSMGNYQYLKNVNANCEVYEIPVKLNYNFAKTGVHNWFVSGGLSSYLMKKESYDYYFKTPAGRTYNKDWSISNKNNHYFSVVSVSGGYEYCLNKKFSAIAEPYVNVPLTGIGAGKVKLNSGGILFTIKVKPFLKSY